jgi:hypothetical protein
MPDLELHAADIKCMSGSGPTVRPLDSPSAALPWGPENYSSVAKPGVPPTVGARSSGGQWDPARPLLRDVANAKAGRAELEMTGSEVQQNNV